MRKRSPVGKLPKPDINTGRQPQACNEPLGFALPVMPESSALQSWLWLLDDATNATSSQLC